jgi:hypothetical protein
LRKARTMRWSRRRAPQAQVDPPRIERIQRAELFGDHQRVVVGQHDPARAQPDRGGMVAHMGERDRHGRAGDPFHAVVFGHPVALIAAALGHLREQGRLGERLAYRSALDHGHEIEDGQFHDGFFSGCVAPDAGLAEGWPLMWALVPVVQDSLWPSSPRRCRRGAHHRSRLLRAASSRPVENCDHARLQADGRIGRVEVRPPRYRCARGRSLLRRRRADSSQPSARSGPAGASSSAVVASAGRSSATSARAIGLDIAQRSVVGIAAHRHRLVQPDQRAIGMAARQRGIAAIAISGTAATSCMGTRRWHRRGLLGGIELPLLGQDDAKALVGAHALFRVLPFRQPAARFGQPHRRIVQRLGEADRQPVRALRRAGGRGRRRGIGGTVAAGNRQGGAFRGEGLGPICISAATGI